MRVLKYLFWLVILTVLLLALVVGFGLNSESFLNKVATFGIKQSGLDIRYKKISGGLYSGLKIEGFEYEDKIRSNLTIDLDFKALKNGHLLVNDLNVSNLVIDKKFLSSLLDTNSSKESKSETKLPIKDIDIKKLHLDLSDLSYKEYEVYDLSLDVRDFKSNLKDSHSGKIDIVANTNIAKLDGEVKLRGKKYDIRVDSDLKRDFIKRYIKDQNITLNIIPHIHLKANGDLEDVDFNLLLSGGDIDIDSIKIEPKRIKAKGSYGIKSGKLRSDLNLDIDSSLANLLLDSDIKLNTNDLNDSLSFYANSKIKPSNSLLKDQNLTVKKMPQIFIDAKGDLKKIELNSSIDSGKLSYNDIKIEPKKLNIKAQYFLQNSDLKAKVGLVVDSNIADLNLDAKTDLNLADLNSTLKYSAISTLKAKEGFLKKRLKDTNITLFSLSPLKLNLKGDAKELDTNITLDGELEIDKLKAKPLIKDSNIHLNLLTKELNSNLMIMLNTNRGNALLKSKANLNLNDINSTLKYDMVAKISDTKPYKGVDLSSLGDILLDAKGSLKNLQAKLRSDKIKADINSSDFDRFSLKLDTKKIYLKKIYRDISPDLNRSFVALKSKGSYILSSKTLHLISKLDGFRYNNQTITTNEFVLDIKKDEITLSPVTIRAGDFKLNAFIKKVGDKFVAKLKNRAINLDANFKISPLYVVANGEINSIKSLIKEVNNLYPLKDDFGVDGRLKFSAKSKEDKIIASITSPKITLKEGRLERVKLRAIYQPHKILIKNFDFDMRGFGDKSMNREVRLKRDGIITFDDENATIDIELKNLAYFKATKRGDVIKGKLNSKRLTLSYPKMGHTTISSNIDIFQSKDKRAITGKIEFSDTEINYESRYLDISKDSDIIIINGKKQESDDFKNNTFLDLKIFSKDNIIYKVRAGQIEMKPNIVIRKEFGDTPRIRGKIKIMGGEYDLADKRFKIKEGAVAFRGLKEVNPLLDLHVSYDELDEIDIFIDISGDKNRPRLKFSSKPPKPKKDIFSYLLFGMSASESEDALRSANKAAERIFGRAISKDLARELHLDRLDLERNMEGNINIKAGKKVGKKTIFYYQNRDSKSSIIVERKLDKNWDVSIESGDDGEAVDFIYRKGYK